MAIIFGPPVSGFVFHLLNSTNNRPVRKAHPIFSVGGIFFIWGSRMRIYSFPELKRARSIKAGLFYENTI